MNALRKIHEALVPGGVLLDMHPVPPSARAEVEGRSLGEFEDAAFFELVAATEDLLSTSGLFEPEAELQFDWLERYDSGDELLKDVKSWEGCRIPRALAARIRKAEPPIDIWERVVFRRLSRSRG
ncbi:MAG: hypothetical protein AABM30_00335 [Actinomycetota bacterium]